MDNNLEHRLDCQGIVASITDNHNPQTERYISKERINTYQGYKVMCTKKAEKSLRNSAYMDAFKQRFRQIIQAPHLAESNVSKDWGYVWQVRVIEGRLNKNLRIVFEVKNNTVHVYDIEKHDVYERKILPMLKNGAYLKKETYPLVKFSCDESTAKVA